ncbi:MAG: hypothetical protein FJ096_00315 [Deltaproteobacteria bacterium]|nr:hypothetical protein [Deltaproteobacteria bacterium]
MKPTLSQSLAATLLAFATACSPPPQPPEEPKVEESPPPPCESLSERCIARSDTRAKIPGLSWSITPPSGWVYAQQADSTIAQRVKDSGVLLAVTSVDSPGAAPDPRNSKAVLELKNKRIDNIEKLAKQWGIQLAQRNIVDYHIRQDYDSIDVAGIKLSIWEQESARRSNAAGNVVVVVGDVDGRDLVLVAFVPKAGSHDAVGDSEAVSNTLQSLAFRAKSSKTSGSQAEGKSP